MQVRGEQSLYCHLGPINVVVFLMGIALLLFGFLLDWIRLFTILGFPMNELNNPWVQSDIATIRAMCILIGTFATITPVVIWRYFDPLRSFSEKLEDAIQAAARSPLFVPLCLMGLILAKTVLQLGLYFMGYSAFGADDFGRALSADYWLYYRRFDLGWEGWLGLGGSGWLPFSDYLFGVALALKRDLFLTPKVVNLVLSGLAVLMVYLLGRELFGRRTGLFAAFLFAFQPWHVWLGISGMTSDLPSIVLMTCFAMFLFRWLQADEPRLLLAAAGSLAVANGFRYENWFFAVVFSLYIVYVAVLRVRQRRLDRRWVTVAACVLTIINGFPVIWMAASYYVLGDWLPALHKTNAFMVASFMDSSQPSRSHNTMGIPLIAAGSFPFELALAGAGIVLSLTSDKRKFYCLYLGGLAATFLLYVAVFKGQLQAYLVISRYLLPFLIFLLPYAGFLLSRLLWTQGTSRYASVLAAYLILLTIGTFDILRGLNYPASFPNDAVAAGWSIRGLQRTGSLSENAKILIERAADYSDEAIVALVNRPERFVVLNELVYRQQSLDELANRPATVSFAESGVRGTACDHGFQAESCRQSVLREMFDLVVLSSPMRIASFRETFQVPSWTVARYHIFDMRALPLRTESPQGTAEISSY
jgi:Dolichyl-phosphate-mannose-protein mannosyltransferase